MLTVGLRKHEVIRSGPLLVRLKDKILNQTLIYKVINDGAGALANRVTYFILD
jgi:hypothetical protein